MLLKYVPSKTCVISIRKVVMLRQSQERMMLQTKSVFLIFIWYIHCKMHLLVYKTDAHNWRKT